MKAKGAGLVFGEVFSGLFSGLQVDMSIGGEDV